MFRGSSFHTIDPKGRIIVPTRFREVIKESGTDSIMITRMDSCLFAYAHDRWAELEQKILHLPEKSEEMRRFQRFFIGGAQDCKCDAQGRVLIPPFLKQYSELEKEIVLVGVLDRFEIWSRENWDRENGLQQKDMGNEQVRREIAQLGI
ncbi:transcriptional regulator MraZ [Desulfosarcina widdelii]|uniref:Transcriptional regulator MraZ n=1 Tax=Desulfosarcina widdelii TaxID=947919 RepID=A0A5K7Z3A0_9BACT|nr:division/cell wall cluster transcriptional repressor MraZ [Desulfosarcina widdelii]BBO75140.1 transcriptional regulator MraZ [Desulfosarcina widdelii]